MRTLTTEETEVLFAKLAKYIGRNIAQLTDRPNDPHCFLLHRDRVYYVREELAKKAEHIPRDNLLTLGSCLGKFTKSGKFKMHITALDYLAPFAKPTGETTFLYGGHIIKAHLAKISEETPEHQGIVVYSSNEIPLGFAVTARSSVDCLKLDPTGICCFNQADIGEYLRDEGALV